ncbi:MAG TPA: response regulator transcription factor [Bryobacteraceae bacterium]|nr:response regulator transcription factor [Bryobacteraceae bacterium]
MAPKLVVGDDHTLFLQALCNLLGSDYDLVGTAENGRDLIALVQERKPDLVLLDISMPILNGIEAMREIRKSMPKVQFVVVTQQANKEYVAAALRAGARGYVLKNSAASELSTAIRNALAGKYYVTPLIPVDVASLLDEKRFTGKLFEVPLSPRKREVLQLVAEGKSVKEIAHLLAISNKTVEFHKAAIMDQLGMRTTAELTRYAIENGIVKT